MKEKVPSSILTDGRFRYRFYLLLLLILSLSRGASAQSTGSTSSFNFETSVNSVTACGDNGFFRVKLTAVVALSGNSLTVTMPSGVAYVSQANGGGLAILSGTGTVTEGSLANLSAPVFTISDLAVGNVLEFTYAVRAYCGIIPYVEALNVPFNGYSFAATTPARTETFNTVGFNVLYGVPSIIDVLTNGVSTPGYLGNIGDVIERKVTIKNGGNGQITTDTYLELDGSYTYSSINAPFSAGVSLTGSRLSLSTAAFGGDGIWSPDETIEVTYQETILSCPVGTPSRNIYAGYGCSSTDCKTSQTKATQFSTPYLPNLDMRMVNNWIVCPGEEPYTGTVTIINRGLGTARNVLVRIQNNAYSSPLYDPHVYLDTTNVMYSINGGTPKHPYPVYVLGLTIPATNRLCDPGVASTMTGLADYNFGDLAPGDSLVVFVSGNSCLSTVCEPLRATFFAGYASWQQGCSDTQIAFTGMNHSGGTPGGAYVSVSDNGAVQITGNNKPVEIGLFYVNLFIKNPADGGYLDVCVTIPPGLTLDETQPDSYVIANVNDPLQIWRPSSYVRSGNTICYKFLHTTLTAGVFGASGAVQKFALSQDCASGSGVLPLSFTYTVKNSDACILEHQLTCYTRDIVSLCPSPPCPQGGLALISSSANRKNYGLPDNDNNAHADGSGVVDFSKVATTQYILGDTMQYTYSGVIAGTSDLATYPLNSQFEYGYLNVGIPTSGATAFFELLGSAQVSVKKAAGGTVTCAVASSAGATSFNVLLNNCTALSGYVFQPGDTISVEQLLLTNSSANMESQAVVPSTSYASHVLDPDGASRYGCGISFDRYRVSGFGVSSHGGNYAVDCEGNANVFNVGGLRNNIINGTVGGAYGYGNAFPYEYRNISYPIQFKYLLPPGYAYDPASPKYVHFDVGPGVSFNFPMNEPTMSGDTLVFDIRNIYTAHGGTLDYPDEGFNVNPILIFKSICGAPAINSVMRMVAVQVTSDPEVARLLALAHPAVGTPPNQNFATYSGNQYSFSAVSSMYKTAAAISLSPISTVSNSEDGTATYRISLSNYGAAAVANTWLHAKNEHITITEIIDESNSTAIIPDVNGFFQLGNYPGGQARNYTLKGVLATCEDAEDFIFAGACGAYPTSLANACAKDTLVLTAHPGETDFQTILTGPNAEVPLCDDADFSFEVKASKLGNVKDLVVNFQLPSGSTIVAGSVYYNYPGDATAILAPDPASLTGTAVFNLSGYSTQLGTVGLRGVGTSDADSSEVKVKFKVRTDCSFAPGARFRAEYLANDACGNALAPRANTADLAIPGLGALPYRTTVLLISADTAHCAETPTKMLVSITNVLGGTVTGSNDSVYVELPPNVSFLSYTPTADGGDYLNAPVAAPSVYGIAGGFTRVSFLMPAGVASGASINFPLLYSHNASALLCDLDSVSAYTGVVNTTGCSTAPGGSCSVLVLNSVVPGKAIPYFQPDATFAYSVTRACASDTDPAPILNCAGSASVGTFSAPAGLKINPVTGVIDPSTSTTGTYLVTYTIPADGTSCLASQDTTTITINGGACPLPVTLISFTATKQTEGEVVSAMLNWATAAETNSDRFEIERSSDAKNWTRLGKVAGKGETTAAANYFFKDIAPLDGENLYRLKMIDKDATFTYSRIRDLRFDSPLESVFPNPVTDKLEIRAKDWSKVNKVEVYDKTGRKLYQSSGKPTRTIDVKSLSAGLYMVFITHSNGAVSNYKIVVAR